MNQFSFPRFIGSIKSLSSLDPFDYLKWKEKSRIRCSWQCSFFHSFSKYLSIGCPEGRIVLDGFRLVCSSLYSVYRRVIVFKGLPRISWVPSGLESSDNIPSRLMQLVAPVSRFSPLPVHRYHECYMDPASLKGLGLPYPAITIEPVCIRLKGRGIGRGDRHICWSAGSSKIPLHFSWTNYFLLVFALTSHFSIFSLYSNIR